MTDFLAALATLWGIGVSIFWMYVGGRAMLAHEDIASRLRGISSSATDISKAYVGDRAE